MNEGKRMALFRLILLALAALLWFLTVRATMLLGVAGSGIFVSDFDQPWRAMINTDFTVHILLVVLWILYRERSIAVGILCVIGELVLGMPFTLLYIVVTTYRERGDLRRVLLGCHFPA
jgi:hypothetical protein